MLLYGAWVDAIGTIVSAYAELREISGFNDENDKIVSIGEGLQAVGTAMMGIVTTEDLMNFAGTWVDAAGAATASLAAYRQSVEGGESDANLRLEVLGDTFQAMGSAMSALAEYRAGVPYAGNVLQSLGATLEALGALFEQKSREEQGQMLATVGAIIQATGANLNAVLISFDHMNSD